MSVVFEDLLSEEALLASTAVSETGVEGRISSPEPSNQLTLLNKRLLGYKNDSRTQISRGLQYHTLSISSLTRTTVQHPV